MGKRLRRLLLGSALPALLCWVSLAHAAPAKDPIKIGFMAPFVGVYTQLGIDMERGFKLYLEEIGYKAGGRQITVVTEDTEGKPELGPTKARKLIDNDKVSLLAGIVHSGVAMSVREIVTEQKIPLIITNAGAPELTAAKKSPYIFRVSFANGQQDLAGGWYAYNKLGYKRMVIIAPDYSAGHDKADGFMKYFKESGGKIVEEMYPPLTTNDFGPYLTKIADRAKEVDAVWSFFSGSGSIRLITQYQEYGLKDAIPLFVIGDTIDDSVLPSMKDAAIGVKSYHQYADAVKNPENEKFVKAYRAKYKVNPGTFSEQGYVGAKVIAMAIEAVKGNVENREAFAAAMRKIKFNAPRGPFAFDENQNVILPVYIRRTDKIGGQLQHVILDSIPNVDQNWTPAKLKK
ncbi:MAG: ABC transporter substrate-binding protein [Deltaproteobacteria bacterium]|nr:ABC transporter substrate-binding protein [Deltaproteobacteria bacterium]